MKEAFGNAFIMGLVITFVAVFIFLFATSTSYTKAFKVKNKIIEILEKYDDILKESSYSGGNLNSDVEAEINEVLSEMGYRIGSKANDCDERNGALPIKKTTTANYEYCIYAYSTNKGTYYGVTAYVYYEVPIVGIGFKLPVYGETKINGILG